MRPATAASNATLVSVGRAEAAVRQAAMRLTTASASQPIAAAVRPVVARRSRYLRKMPARIDAAPPTWTASATTPREPPGSDRIVQYGRPVPNRVYVASPLGFFEAGRRYHDAIKVELAAAGLEPVDPWEDPDSEVARELARIRALPDAAERDASFAALNFGIGEKNAELIDTSDAMLAVLDGPDVDSGTASEIGYASAREKVVVGLRTDSRFSGDNEGTPINLQVRYFIERAHGEVVTTLEDAVRYLVGRSDVRAGTAPASGGR